MGIRASIRAATPRLPLGHATTLQHRRQGTGEYADVMLSDQPWPRRSARPMISPFDSCLGGVMEGYMLWTASASAEPPIVYGRLRPMAGALPQGTEQGRDTRPLGSQRHSSFWCSERGHGAGRWPSQRPLGEAQTP